MIKDEMTEEYLINWCRGDLQVYYKTILWSKENDKG